MISKSVAQLLRKHPVKYLTIILVITFYNVCQTVNEEDDDDDDNNNNNNNNNNRKCGHSGLNALTI